MSTKLTIELPVNLGYLVRKALPVGILDHPAMKRLEWCSLAYLNLDKVSKDVAKKLKAATATVLRFGTLAMTDLDSNLLVMEIKVDGVEHSVLFTLAPILPSKEYDPSVSSLLGKRLPGLPEALAVHSSAITVVTQ